MTPSGMFLQSTWNQWQETDLGEVYNSDAWYRRILFLDEIENPNKTGGGAARVSRRRGADSLPSTGRPLAKEPGSTPGWTPGTGPAGT